MSRLEKITVGEVREIVHIFAQKFLEWDEPIPEFETRYPGILESCVATPFQTFSKRELYPGLIPKAAILFYLMVKNHPFKNGNKRIAVVTLLTFLFKNKKWLSVDAKSLYEFAKWVASSNPQVRSEVTKAIEKFIDSNTIDAQA
jgi:death-on-curing family protein